MESKLSKNLLGIMLGLVALAIVPWAVQAGSLEPSAPPAPTTQIPPAWSQILPDADRFELVLGGTAVLDKETGLVWRRIIPVIEREWLAAIIHCYQTFLGGRGGWRLPTVEELASLVDRTQSNPALPSGHPFIDVQSSDYWAATTSAGITTSASIVVLSNGAIGNQPKVNLNFVWCVRGGQGHDAY